MMSDALTRPELEQLLKQNDASITLKKVRQSEHVSSFWPRFSLVFVNDVSQNFVLCDKCRKLIAYKSSTGTGGLKKHLTSCEKDSVSDTTQQRITTYYVNKKLPNIPEKVKNQVSNAYVEFVALDGRPFEMASRLGFQQLIEAVFKAGQSAKNLQSVEISNLIPHSTTVSATSHL